MGPGGAQRVVSLLSTYWIEAGWDLHLITLYPRVDAFSLPDSIGRTDYIPPPRPWLVTLARNFYLAAEEWLSVRVARSDRPGLYGKALSLLHWAHAKRLDRLTRRKMYGPLPMMISA